MASMILISENYETGRAYREVQTCGLCFQDYSEPLAKVDQNIPSYYGESAAYLVGWCKLTSRGSIKWLCPEHGAEILDLMEP